MGKALPITHKFQPDTLGARAPQSFRSGVFAPEARLLDSVGRDATDALGNHALPDSDAALQEDAYWHGAFMRESYYVPGRGYDQYRPAYAMGWQAAFKESAAAFEQIEQVLEQQWEAYDTRSLLDWSEVRGAVYAAWLRGRKQWAQSESQGAYHKPSLILRPLWRLQMQTACDLSMWLRQAEPPPTEFVRQVVDRHVQMLQQFSQELPQTMSVLEDWVEPFSRVGTSIHSGWMWVRSKIQDVSTQRILQLCDAREQKMLALYEHVLSDVSLVSELRCTVQHQRNQLQVHHTKLQWVRQHWMQHSHAM